MLSILLFIHFHGLTVPMAVAYYRWSSLMISSLNCWRQIGRTAWPIQFLYYHLTTEWHHGRVIWIIFQGEQMKTRRTPKTSRRITGEKGGGIPENQLGLASWVDQVRFRPEIDLLAQPGSRERCYKQFERDRYSQWHIVFKQILQEKWTSPAVRMEKQLYRLQTGHLDGWNRVSDGSVTER